MKPLIAAVIAEPGKIIRDSISAKRNGADMLEFRIDLLSATPEQLLGFIKTSKKQTKLPIIGTIRLKSEGGEFVKSEKHRLELFRIFMPLLDYVDIELSSNILPNVIRLSNKYNKKAIISYHNFKSTPDISILKNIVKKAAKYRPAIIKIATNIKKPSEFTRLSSLLQIYNKLPISIIPMPKSKALRGLRILSLCLGSLLAYASTGKSVAPGQLSLKEHIKFRSATKH